MHRHPTWIVRPPGVYDTPDPPRDSWFEQEGEWYGWVESELHGIRTNIVQLHANVENAIQNSGSFMQEHQKRIDQAMEDYLTAISEQFAKTDTALEKVKENLQSQFSGTMKIMEDKVRLEIQNMFSAQSLENGFLWQNLVTTCNQNFATVLQVYVEKVAPQWNEHT